MKKPIMKANISNDNIIENDEKKMKINVWRNNEICHLIIMLVMTSMWKPKANGVMA